MGGGGTTSTTTQVIQPTPPPQPSTAEAIQEYVKSLPQIFQAQLDFAPQEAAQQVQLAQQFALPLAETFREAQAELFPETAAIQEELARESLERIRGGAPESVRSRFLDDFRANLGTNVGSPIGAVGTARSLAELDELFRQQARSTALSLAGRQPLAQPTVPQFTNQLQNFNARDALGFQAQNFNTFSQASRPLLAQNSFGSNRRGFSGGFNSRQGLNFGFGQ